MNLIDKSIKEIGHLIPQKDPFVMVDTLEFFTETQVKSSFTVKKSNIFYSNGVFTESGLVENMAQTVALHTGYDFFRKGEEAPTGYIGSVKKVAIEQLPKLGETITTQVEILQEFMGVTMVSIHVFNNENQEIATAEMKTVIAGE